MYPPTTRDLFVDNDEDGDIAKCGRARRRVMRSGQHVSVAFDAGPTSTPAFRYMYGWLL